MYSGESDPPPDSSSFEQEGIEVAAVSAVLGVLRDDVHAFRVFRASLSRSSANMNACGWSLDRMRCGLVRASRSRSQSCKEALYGGLLQLVDQGVVSGALAISTGTSRQPVSQDVFVVGTCCWPYREVVVVDADSSSRSILPACQAHKQLDSIQR